MLSYYEIIHDFADDKKSPEFLYKGTSTNIVQNYYGEKFLKIHEDLNTEYNNISTTKIDDLKKKIQEEIFKKDKITLESGKKDDYIFFLINFVKYLINTFKIKLETGIMMMVVMDM
jgi:hypothetical protein